VLLASFFAVPWEIGYRLKFYNTFALDLLNLGEFRLQESLPFEQGSAVRWISGSTGEVPKCTMHSAKFSFKPFDDYAINAGALTRTI
jgi:hypothetical protein